MKLNETIVRPCFLFVNRTMATVITTQPTNSTITDPEKLDTEVLTAGVITEEMVHLNSIENEEEKRKLKEKEEKRRSLERSTGYQDCCCVYDVPDGDDLCLVYYCISSCFRSLATCTDNCFNGCANCISSCCDSDNAVVDGQNDHSSCDCSECDCSGCDCSSCDCGDCNCADCAECCLCCGAFLECCKD